MGKPVANPQRRPSLNCENSYELSWGSGSDCGQYKWICGCTRHTMSPERAPIWQAIQYFVSRNNLVVQAWVTVGSTSEFEVVLGIQCPLSVPQAGKPYSISWVATTLLCMHEFIKSLAFTLQGTWEMHSKFMSLISNSMSLGRCYQPHIQITISC